MNEKLNLLGYREKKDHYKKRLIWLALNKFLFPVLGWGWRTKLAARFGSRLGWDTGFYRTVKIFAPWNLQTGEHVMFGAGVEIYNKGMVTIGSNVIVSRDVFFCTASHDISSPTMDLIVKPITVGDNVWIAAKATILPGVTIGEGAIIGACAVVAKDVPPWSVVVGNPARVVGKRELRDETT